MHVPEAAAPGCHVCGRIADPDAPLWERILQTGRWRVVHTFDTSLPGWLVVIPTRHVTAMAQLTRGEAAELGELLQRVSVALEAVTGCVKTYVMLFAEKEGFAHLHVHVVPRSADLPADRLGPGIFGYLGVPRSEQVPQPEVDRISHQLHAALAEPA
jgi:diadenosine tetraphosphate (Ap4A) HIT family hydrolase